MVPKDVDPEAVKKLLDDNWQWLDVVPGSLAGGFIHQGRTDVITFEELDDHQLVVHREFVIAEHDRQKGLRWLRDEIAKPNRKA
jgi:hypothetical protein